MEVTLLFEATTTRLMRDHMDMTGVLGCTFGGRGAPGGVAAVVGGAGAPTRLGARVSGGDEVAACLCVGPSLQSP